jgi:nucleolar pre-ribosomal-associated protein 2
MTSGSPEEREKAYLKDAITLLKSPCEDADIAPRIVLLQAFVSTVQASSGVKKLEEDGLELNSLRDQLLQVATSAVMSGKRSGKGLLTLLAALEALDNLDRQAVKQALSSTVPSLLESSDSLLENGAQAGWEIRMFLANHFPEALVSPLKIKMSIEVPASTEEDGETKGSDSAAAALGKTALLRYVDAVVRSADEDTKLGYLKELLLEESDGQDALGRLLVIYRLIQHLKGRSPPSPSHRNPPNQTNPTRLPSIRLPRPVRPRPGPQHPLQPPLPHNDARPLPRHRQSHPPPPRPKPSQHDAVEHRADPQHRLDHLGPSLLPIA